MPWCDEVDIPSAWGIEIFERKHVRNDYPIAALWEMGVTDLRIPIFDLLNPRVSNRVKQLSALGHRFTVVMFGLPNEERRAALVDHSAGIKEIEVVALFEQWQEFAAPLKELRQGSDFEVYLHAVRPEVEGWTTHHGMHADLTDEVDSVLSQTDLTDAVDGFVFGIRRDMSPFDGYAAVRRCLSGTNYKALLHVPCVNMSWVSASNDEVAEKDELTRVAEATLLARAYPDLSVVIDNFVELDRGYCSCWGLVDRLYNPKDGSRILSSLDSLLPRQISNLSIFETKQHRVLLSESDAGHVLLIIANNETATTEPKNHLPDQLLDQQGTLIDLVTGEEMDASYRTFSASIGSVDRQPSPMLLTLNNE
jgi:hypothetical protein